MKAATIPFLVAVLTLPVLATAQQEEPPAEFRELIEVTEVFLDVLVTDKKGKVVPGLGADDFVVTEDGEPVELTSCAFYTTAYGAEPPAAVESAGESAVEIPASRYFIFFFHDQTRNATPQNRLLQKQLDAGRQAHNWVRDKLTGSDWVAVVSYDVKLVVHQDFTQDRGSLLAAIGDAAMAKDPGVLPPSRRKRETAGTEPSLLRGLPGGADLDKETTRIYDAIRLLAEASRPIVGRKSLLLFTIGFGDLDTRMRTSRGDPRYYPAMEKALNDSNVAVYPIDLKPVEFQGLQEDFLNQLADDSGGSFYTNVVNFTTPLQQIAAENTGYYLMSFRTEHPAGESGYREIKVKVKSGKVRVRTRRGYLYGISDNG